MTEICGYNITISIFQLSNFGFRFYFKYFRFSCTKSLLFYSFFQVLSLLYLTLDTDFFIIPDVVFLIKTLYI